MPSETIITPEARLSYPQFWEPKKAPGASEAKYGCTLIFARGADISKLKVAAVAAARETWDAKADDMIRKGLLKMPFLNGGDPKWADNPGYGEGTVFIRPTSKERPGVVDRKVQPIMDKAEIYPGCYVMASVRAFTYDTNGNRGVSFGLQNVQKVRDGDPLGGRSRPTDDFAPMDDAEMNDLLG